ncbi:MAG: glycosyltransferase [Syntrophobacterales bacterium]|nr:glycosyltransferase [Syntrophobacterales bacterium]
MGIIYGLLNRLFGNCSTRAKHVIYDFHLNLGRDDVPYRFKLMLTRFASRGIDFFLTTSRDEERIYSEMFRIQTQRIRFFPIFAPMHFSNYSEDLGDYIFSYGNSDRDYDTLVEAVRELPIRVIILSQSYRPTVSLPRNVSLITKPCLGTELIKMVLGSRMVVLPLIAHNVSAGQTALLESMALGRTVIVTENFATKEYGIHGESLFFYEAKNIKQLRELIEGLFDDLQTLRRVGEEARRAAAQFPEICLRVFQEVCERLVL